MFIYKNVGIENSNQLQASSNGIHLCLYTPATDDKYFENHCLKISVLPSWILVLVYENKIRFPFIFPKLHVFPNAFFPETGFPENHFPEWFYPEKRFSEKWFSRKFCPRMLIYPKIFFKIVTRIVLVTLPFERKLCIYTSLLCRNSSDSSIVICISSMT